MIRFYKNIDKYTNKYSDLVGNKFESVDELKSEIGLIIAEVLHKHYDKSDKDLNRIINVNINNKLERYYTENNDKIKEISMNQLIDKLYYTHNNIDNSIIVKNTLDILKEEKIFKNPEYNKVLEMYYLQEYNMNEIAEIFSISPTRVRMILDKLIRKLKHPRNSKLLLDNPDVYITPAQICKSKKLKRVDREDKQIEEIAKILVDCYVTECHRINVSEIIVHHMSIDFEHKLRSKVKEYLQSTREMYGKSKLSKMNFLNKMDNSLATQFKYMSEHQIDLMFKEYMYLYEIELSNDLYLLIEKKRIKL